jgi:hypothetical protein
LFGGNKMRNLNQSVLKFFFISMLGYAIMIYEGWHGYYFENKAIWFPILVTLAFLIHIIFVLSYFKTKKINKTK